MRKDNYVMFFKEKVHAESEKLLKGMLSKKEDMYGTLKNILDVVEGLLSIAKTGNLPVYVEILVHYCMGSGCSTVQQKWRRIVSGYLYRLVSVANYA